MKITIETVVNADSDSVWTAWNNPDDINQWNAASDDWHTTNSRVDLRAGGQFSYRMEAKNGSMGFDFEGTYTSIVPNELIEFTLGDDRVVAVRFVDVDRGIKVMETFEAENELEGEQQRQGWQAILDRFAAHVESKQ